MGRVILNRQDYLDKVTACWLGKNIGGTLGAPFEWRRQLNQVSIGPSGAAYTQDLSGEPAPNDDLDIQLLWLIALEEMGPDLDARILSDYWCLYVTPHWAEYGTAKINMRSGLTPPLSGTFRNEFRHSCGAFIRSEIWACIAPGCPEIAAQYAFEDAILDHGNGEGTYAEVFCAALESAAFVMADVRELIDIGLSYIPEDCGVAAAVHTALDAYDAGVDWVDARNEILEKHRGSSRPYRISDEDVERGFREGQRGYDVPSNIGLLILGLMYGEGDFGQTMVTTVNCGEDTDCTCATVGSIYGILHGTDAIPQPWIDPIGRTIKTACLNLGELGYFGNQLPATVDELTERTERITRQVLLRYQERGVILSDEETDLSEFEPDDLRSRNRGATIYRGMEGPAFRFPFFTVAVDYGEAPTVESYEPKEIAITIYNTYKIQANLSLQWYLPEGWKIRPADAGVLQSLPPRLGEPVTAEFTLEPGQIRQTMNRCVLEITSEGRPTVMLVPITLLNGSLMAEREED
jgi:ADP-ribosylglycohydrolase